MGEDIGRSIFPIALLVVGILSGCFFAGATRVASIGAGGQTQHTEANEYPYYVEFRVAVDGVYGHSYIAYGRLDRFGPACERNLRRHPSDWRFPGYGARTFLFDEGGDHPGKGHSRLQ